MRRARILAVGGSALLLGAAWWVWGRDALPDSTWGTVERGDLVLGVEVTGTLKAVHSAFVGPPPVAEVWDFKISMLAPEGKDVKAGTPVLGFDTTELERQLQEKRAASESAAKQIEKKEKDAEIARTADALRLAEAESRKRKVDLTLDVPEDLVKSQDLKKARLDLEDAEHEIAYLHEKRKADDRAETVALDALRTRKAAADRRTAEIEAAIDAMTVKAPRAGTVVYAQNWRDEKKKVGDSAWRGEHVLEIPDLSRMKAEGQVDESDAGRIAVGQTVRLVLEAHPDTEFTGRVASIWSTVQRQSYRNPKKVVRLDIDLDRTDPKKMRPGMRFRGTIETGRVASAVLVPADAVFPTDDGPVAWKKTPLGAERVALTLGARNEEQVEVKRGLEPGDRVARRDLSTAGEAR